MFKKLFLTINLCSLFVGFLSYGMEIEYGSLEDVMLKLPEIYNETSFTERLPYPESEYPAEYIAELNNVFASAEERIDRNSSPESELEERDVELALNIPIAREKYTGEKSLKCAHPECDYAAAYKSRLTRHQITHTGEKTFKCSECEYATGDKSALRSHQRIHTGELFKCDQCNYANASKSNLTTHKRKHTGDLFKCAHPGCDFRTVWKINLTKHQNIPHIKCTYLGCGMTLLQSKLKTHLNIHLKREHDKKPFKCTHPGCDFRTAWENNLIKHQKRPHIKCTYPGCGMTLLQSQLSTHLKQEHQKIIHRPKGKKRKHPEPANDSRDVLVKMSIQSLLN